MTRLDPRTENELAVEARSRIGKLLPELRAGADDPGETLIEVFAWMTGLVAERLARLPDKLHLALLDMLGIQLRGPAAARADIRLRLSAPAARSISVHPGTEVGTLRTATEESIVFHLRDPFTIEALRPVSYAIERAGVAKEIGVADGVAYPHGPDRIPFAQPPVVGDALYLGFEEGIGRLLLQVAIEASMARGAGVKPEDPPLRWETSQGEGRWTEVEVLTDRTGGFNYGSGVVELQCPVGSGMEPVAGRRLHWLRCRIAHTTRLGGETAAYQHAPDIYRITAAPIGALLGAEHSTVHLAEPLGQSDGVPGQTVARGVAPCQTFALRFAPVLTPAAGETLEVQTAAGDWEAWEQVESFAESGPDDRHFTIDLVHGVIRLGPRLQHPDRSLSRRGATPPKGAGLRMSRYRHGGGRAGNVASDSLSTLRSAIPGVASVTNPKPARGGVDPEGVPSARGRAALEIRTRHRAVTAGDYEFLATAASPRVARAVRVQDGAAGVTLGILPRIDPADRRLTIDALTPDPELLEDVAGYLNARKVVGCPLRLVPVRFRGVSVVVNVEASHRADIDEIERRIYDYLYIYLNPLIGGTPTPGAGTPATPGTRTPGADTPAIPGTRTPGAATPTPPETRTPGTGTPTPPGARTIGTGWPFGRPLNQGELYTIVHAAPGVESVRVLRLYEVDLSTGRRATKPAGRQIVLAPDELIASGEHIVRVMRREA